jgi:hypothetical protein
MLDKINVPRRTQHFSTQRAASSIWPLPGLACSRLMMLAREKFQADDISLGQDDCTLSDRSTLRVLSAHDGTLILLHAMYDVQGKRPLDSNLRASPPKV